MKNRHPSLQPLSNDHTWALVLSRAIRVCDEESRAELIEEIRMGFEQILEPHFRQEEEGVLVAMIAHNETKLTAHSLCEHERLRDLVTRLDRPGQLEAFGDALEELVCFEERHLFDACQNLLSDAELCALGRPTLTRQAV